MRETVSMDIISHGMTICPLTWQIAALGWGQRNGVSVMEKPLSYEVTNRRTGKVYNFKTSAAASRAVDRMDNAYGAYICTRRAIWA
jgi:hypothetical protein